MRVLVIGWYGTETIGDRAILAGLIRLITKELGKIDLVLGSLYPFFTERTIHEDMATIIKTSHAEIDISIVDSRNPLVLKLEIKKADLIIMGGGPLMDLAEIYMVDYAFKLAKKMKKKTAILGCGVGPLFKKKYKKAVLSIVENSDTIVLRDNLSRNSLIQIFQEFSRNSRKFNFSVAFDPAVHYVYHVLDHLRCDESSNYIAVNLRSFPSEYSQEKQKNKINEKLSLFVASVADQFSHSEVLLVPMHYFHVGGDDRYFLNEIKYKINKANVKVQNRPLTLEETVNVYANAAFNIGMRFHSVVLQTISSGKNYVLDYTQPKKGKISGFINEIDKTGFYSDRYICLQEQKTDFYFDFSNSLKRFEYDSSLLSASENSYLTQIRKLGLQC